VLPPEQYKSILSAKFVNRSFKGYNRASSFHHLQAPTGLDVNSRWRQPAVQWQKETGPDGPEPACLPQNRTLAIGTIFARFLLDLS
jgi:hypothetical protein